VSIHTFGSAVATMQFSRNLCATMVVAVFGVIVLTGGDGIAAAQYSAEGFSRIFLVVAASFTICLAAILMIEEKPLQTAHA
jgi:hypothetical protein